MRASLEPGAGRNATNRLQFGNDLQRPLSGFSDIVRAVLFRSNQRCNRATREVNASTFKSFLRACRTLIGAAAATAALATPALADSSSVWQADVYYPIGSIVSYQGRSYEARVSQVDFHGAQLNPTVASLWKPIGAASGAHLFNLRSAWFSRTSTPVESRCAPAWSTDNTYTTGGAVSVEGINYRANWWTRGESPVTHSAAGEPWTVIGSCSAKSNTAASGPVPAPDSNSGSIVQAQGDSPRG